MKNYEEMSRSVLKRRDTEIKRRRRAFLIGAPCAAAAIVGVVGIGASIAANSHGKYMNLTIAKPGDFNDSSLLMAADASADIGEAEIADAIGIDIAPVEPEPIDYTNPNVGDTKIVITYIDYSESQDKPLDLDENDFTPYSLEQLDSFYNLRFNRLGELYPSWTLSYDKLGVYRHETNDGFIASLKLVGTLNTLDYTTENGGKVSVSAQYEEFAMPMIGDHIATFKKNITPVYPEVKYEYDEDGNIIGASTGAYDPTSNTSAPYVEGETNPDTGDEAWSKINGYDALIVAVLNNEHKVDHYTAYIKMSSYVRITAYNTDQFMFEEILDNFTNNIEGPFKVTDRITNPDVGKNDIKVLELDEFNISDYMIDLSKCTFNECTFEELDSHYHQRFNVLKELHPDWELSYDKLGVYYTEFNSERPIFGLAWDRNTLNYTTDSGAKITVSTGGYLFRPISDERLTRMKPDDPSKFITEPAIADDGTPIGYLSRPIDPNDYLPEPDEGVSTVNGCEALIYRNADGNFLADIDMDFEIVRITAEGLSEEEFLTILDEYTKYKIVLN